MTKAWAILAVPALLAGCGGDQRHSVKAEVTLAPNSGALTLACKESSSGECHAVVVGTELSRGVAQVGRTASIDGAMPGARFCVSDVEPEPDKCDLKEIAVGTTIVRQQKIGRN